ncbi:MAG TPA: aminotransferase class V-fold PLP-dependent enzyme [Bryobacteraceae bacterium]|nr:aminotransferase class V-fold PLP-dependent enzyme [Bryobacteraceae bacterium]
MEVELEYQEGLNNRRTFLKLLAATPLFATLGTRRAAAAVAATTAKAAKATGFRRSYTDNIYTRLGVQPVINGLGTYTYVGGTLQLPEALRAYEEAAHYFVDMFELQVAAGAHLAKISGAEDGMVTDGAAAAISCATAGCIAGSDPNNILKLPDTTGMKNEVVLMGGRSAFDDCISLCGAKLVVAHTVQDLPGALTPQTAMIYTDWQEYDRVSSILKISKPAGVPLLVDAADGLPPFEKFSHYSKLGVDLYDFSGGKGLCGPQASGVLLGRKDLITAAKYNSDPWEGGICRPMKFGKEEIMALLAVIDWWTHADLAALNKEWRGRVERIAKMVETVPGVTTSIAIPAESNCYPTLTVNWDEQKFGLTVAQCAQQLYEGKPRIQVGGTTESEGVRGRVGRPAPRPGAPPRHRQLQITSMTLQPGEDLIVGHRLRQILNDARKRAS